MLNGAVHETLTCMFPRTATTAAGASGTETGMTEADAVEAEDVPITFEAVTVKV